MEKKLPTVRLMAPFPMRCTSCGEFIYKGRKFNARKETTDEKYLAIAIYRFWIKCTACSSSISFKTNPRTMDYDCESGAQRSFERWRQTGEENVNNLETEEEMLDRLEAEAAETSAMGDLERKVEDAKTEMEIADALDEIRTRNARVLRAEGKAGEQDAAIEAADRARVARERERERMIEEEDERAAKRAFGRLGPSDGVEVEVDEGMKSRAAGRRSGLRNELLAYSDDDEGGDDAAEPRQTISSLPRAPATKLDGASAAAAAAEEKAGEGEDYNDDATRTSSTLPTTTTPAQTRVGDMLPPPPPTPPPSFKRVVKKKKDFAAALGIKKKPALV